MNYDKISQNIHEAHDSVAFRIAQDYLANLAKDTENTLGTLAGLLHTFRADVAEMVASRAASKGANRCKYRPELVLAMATGYVRDALRANPEQAKKLLAIRAAQEAKVRADAMAEQATWTPLPVG